jgi:Tfp pilus assembly protein PilZ
MANEAEKLAQAANADAIKVPRQFGRITVDCDGVLAFPARQAHPRLKCRLIQIGKGGCAIETAERLFIGEECLVWAHGGGSKFLGHSGHVVWMKAVYKGQKLAVVGIEFKTPIEVTDELIERLRANTRTIIKK